MHCPIKHGENPEMLLDYGAGKLDEDTRAALEQHMTTCAACRDFGRNQQAVWSALENWEAPPVSADFDRRLYGRIEQEVSWWDLVIRPFRPIAFRQVLPVAATLCVMLMAIGLLRQPTAVAPEVETESAQLESVQPEQVEHALEDMRMLSDFNHQVRAAASESPM